MTVIMLLYFIFVHLTLLIPGYTAVKNTGLLRDKPALELCAAYFLGVASFAALAILHYTLALPAIWLQFLLWTLVIAGFYFFITQKLYKPLLAHWIPVTAAVGMSLFACLFISLSFTGPRTFIPDPTPQFGSNYDVLTVKVLNVAQTPANDNSIPYRQAQFMVNRSDPAKDSFIDEWGVHFFQRTPLMGAVTAQYFILLGDQPPIGYTWSAAGQDPDNTYAKFQVIAHVLNALFVVPAFFLLSYFFNRRTASVSLLFLIPSHFFLYNSFFSWPKSLVAFFVLFSWLLIVEKRFRYVVLAGLVSGAGYLAHDLAVLYWAASALLLTYFRRFRDLFVFGAFNVLVALPWVITSALIYKKPSSFIYYPLSIHDIPQIDKRHEIVKEFLHTSPLRLLAIRLESLFYLLSPYQLIYSEGGQVIGRRLWAGSLFNVPGAIGFGLVIPVLIGIWHKIRNIPFWILALVPIIMSVLVIGWPKGLGALHFAEASVVLFVGLGVWLLLGLKNRWWLLAAYAVNCVQLIFFILYSYGSPLKTWLTNPQDILILAGLAGIVVACGIGIYYGHDPTQKRPHWLKWLGKS